MCNLDILVFILFLIMMRLSSFRFRSVRIPSSDWMSAYLLLVKPLTNIEEGEGEMLLVFPLLLDRRRVEIAAAGAFSSYELV